MSATIIANSLVGTTPPAPPIKDNGAAYVFSMHYGDFSHIVYADTASEALDILIPGYANMSEENKANARARYAQGVQVSLRASILVSIPDIEPEDFAVLASNNRAPHDFEDWTAEAPLVLLSTDYSGNEIDGNVLWIRPENDESLLQSLDTVGVIAITVL